MDEWVAKDILGGSESNTVRSYKPLFCKASIIIDRTIVGPKNESIVSMYLSSSCSLDGLVDSRDDHTAACFFVQHRQPKTPSLHCVSKRERPGLKQRSCRDDRLWDSQTSTQISYMHPLVLLFVATLIVHIHFRFEPQRLLENVELPCGFSANMFGWITHWCTNSDTRHLPDWVTSQALNPLHALLQAQAVRYPNQCYSRGYTCSSSIVSHCRRLFIYQVLLRFLSSCPLKNARLVRCTTRWLMKCMEKRLSWATN